MFHDKVRLDQMILEMRWRCLSLAADLDRVDRQKQGDPGGPGGRLASNDRLARLREALAVLCDDKPDRAERVQMIFSDRTPGPVYSKSISKSNP